MEPDRPVGEEAPELRLDERIVDLLTREGGRHAFNGLRRALGVHPESLSRALRRLERGGAVLHDTVGYAVADEARAGDLDAVERDLRSIAELDLPDPWTEEAVLGALAGRWSGSLRWVGSSERPEGMAMIWSVEGGDDRVVVSVRHRHLSLLVSHSGSSISARSELAALGLLRHVLDPPDGRAARPSPRSVSTFEAAQDQGAPRNN